MCVDTPGYVAAGSLRPSCYTTGSSRWDKVDTHLTPLQAQKLADILDYWVALEDLPSDTLSSWPQRVEIGCSSTAFYPQLYVVLTDPKGERPYAEFAIQQEKASLNLLNLPVRILFSRFNLLNSSTLASISSNSS